MLAKGDLAPAASGTRFAFGPPCLTFASSSTDDRRRDVISFHSPFFLRITHPCRISYISRTLVGHFSVKFILAARIFCIYPCLIAAGIAQNPWRNQCPCEYFCDRNKTQGHVSCGTTIIAISEHSRREGDSCNYTLDVAGARYLTKRAAILLNWRPAIA